MKRTRCLPLLVIVGVCVGCEGANDPCADGHVDTIIVGKDAFVIEGFDQGLLAGGRSEDQVFPYADGSPFLTCTSVGTLLVREVIDGIDGDRDFPELEELGSIFVDYDDSGGDVRAVPLIAGFESVTSLGSIGGVRGLANLGSIDEVAGFNNVTAVGSLSTNAVVPGFRALREVTGRLSVGTLDGPQGLVRVGGEFNLGFGLVGALELASLEEVGGDLIVSSTRLTSLSFPALSRVGGDYLVDVNPFERFSGAQPGARIEGDFTAQGNQPMRNADFSRWLEDNEISVGGRVKICLNGEPKEEGDTCNEI